jgi:hypothetical protein
VWQALREELHPGGLEIVTVALETRGPAEAERWIAAASPMHPSLIDQGHLLDELYGVRNVPSGIWVDEGGRIVRPPETAFPKRPAFTRGEIPEGVSPYRREVLLEARKIRIEPDKYIEALRDWVALGPASRFALSAEEVVRRGGERSAEAARAAAEFELAQHLQRNGSPELAVPHFREAHRLQPENWTYKRQAWSIANRDQAPSEQFEGDWLSETRRIGAENYYPPLDM